jgi:acyl-CoA thioesterase FadM
MRWIRLLVALGKAKIRNELKASEISSLEFRVWLTDIDVAVMNHAAIMTVFEMGRIDFMVRTGFFRIATKNKWFFPSQAIDVQFYRPLKLLQKATVLTRLSCIDEHFFFVEQKILSGGKPVASCFANGIAKKGRETVKTSEVLNALQIDPMDLPSDRPRLAALFEDKNREMTARIIDRW